MGVSDMSCSYSCYNFYDYCQYLFLSLVIKDGDLGCLMSKPQANNWPLQRKPSCPAWALGNPPFLGLRNMICLTEVHKEV